MKTSGHPIIRFHRSWRSLLPQFVLGVLCAVIGYIVTQRYPESVLEMSIPLGSQELLLKLPFFLLLVLFVVARPFFKLFNSYAEISEHHLKIVSGRLSLWKKAKEFAFEDLLGVEVSQSIFGRIVNVGTIHIGSKTPSINLEIHGVADPHKYANIICRHIDASRMELTAALLHANQERPLEPGRSLYF